MSGDGKTGQGPLAGLRVVEFTGLGPAPLAGQLLADHGAEVVAVDRKSGRADPTDVNRRGKRSVALDLRQGAGVVAARRLLAKADVLIEGFRPGVMERLGLGPEPCLQDNPGLVYARMTGWGQSGPLAATAGHDLNYLGLSGALHAMGRAGEPPLPPLNLVADFGGGTMFLVFGILAALYERQRSGRGQVVDAAMVDGVPAMMGLLHGMRAKGLWRDAREDNLLDGGAPFYRCYACADGKFLSVGPLEPAFFAQMLERAGLPASDSARQMDRAEWPAMHAAYEAAFRQRTRDEWMVLFDGSDACVGPVLDWEEAPHHPHNVARGVFTEVAGVWQAAPAPRLDRSPARTPQAPTAPGADGEAVLRECGYADEELAALKAARVLG